MRSSTKDGAHEQAAELFSTLIEARVFPEFMTIPTYDIIAAGAA